MDFVQKYKTSLIGLLIGGVLGYAYYYFVGCTSGSCAITSKPVNSTLYGMLMGYLALSVFENSNPKKKENV